ncbi:MAG: MmgE/PrpD family protein [Thermodesulfobacteriota bacterium]
MKSSLSFRITSWAKEIKRESDMARLNFHQFYYQTKNEMFPLPVLEKVKLCILDTIGAIISGHSSKAGPAAILFGKKTSSGHEATVLGTSTRMSWPYAAFCNAILGSAWDIDDGSLLALGHPGAATLSAALGAAQLTGSSGNDLLRSVLFGYEIALLTGSRLNAVPDKRFFGSGAWAAAGAAAAAGYLLGLDLESLVNAIGLAEAHAPVSPVDQSIEDGAMVKESLGWAAFTGVCACLLSAAGFGGITPRFHDRSFPALEEVDSFRILSIYFKKYTCCRWGHAALDGVLELMDRDSIDASKIMEVTIGTHSKGMLLNGRNINSPEKAQYSLPFCIAAALVDKEVGPKQVSPKRLNDPILTEIMNKVRLEVDPEIDAAFPKFNSARVSIRTAPDIEYNLFVKNAKGSEQNPLSHTDIIDKFLWITDGLLSRNQALSLVERIQGIETVDNIKAIFDELTINEKIDDRGSRVPREVLR